MTSSINQLRMNMLDMQAFQTAKANRPTVDNLIQTEEKEEKVFATKGEDNYNEAMDFNGDGIVTYDEYMRYCEENAVSEYKTNPSVTFVIGITSSPSPFITFPTTTFESIKGFKFSIAVFITSLILFSKILFFIF